MSELLRIEVEAPIAVLTLARPEKRNAVNVTLVKALGAFFADPPEGVRAAALVAEGNHFCAGLDLDEASRNNAFGTMELSRLWHRELDKVEHGRIPVVSGLQGAV